MDIPALSMSMAAADLSTSVNMSLMKMAKESMEQESSDFVKLLNSSVLNVNIDPSGLDISV